MRSYSFHATAAACLLLLAAALAPRGGARADVGLQELFRVRVTNEAGGAVEVSADGGATYYRVGKVVRPATGLVAGFAASRWAPPGSVAAVAVHGLRVKVRASRAGEAGGAAGSMMLSLVPREFHTSPKAYAGHQPGASGIYTDIAAGEAIFRNLSPFVGNPVRLELPDRLAPFPENYVPRHGDKLVFLALLPPALPRAIVFENWKGGQVLASFGEQEPQPIARVARPVLGVGRYDGTTYTGVGRINTNHPGVITISTAGVTGFLLREGEGSERRGGIQIEPSHHAEAVSYNAPQVLVVAPLEGQASLEGQPPLFAGYLGLFWDRRNADRSEIVDVKIDNGPWEPMPEVLGKVDDAFTAPALNRYFRARGVDRRITSGVTHLRILFPRLDPTVISAFVEGLPASGGGGSPALVGGAPPAPAPRRVQGVVTLNVELKNIGDPKRIAMMMVYVDERAVAILNMPPFRHDLDTRRLANGPHDVELRAVDAEGNIIAQHKTRVMVDNAPPPEQVPLTSDGPASEPGGGS